MVLEKVDYVGILRDRKGRGCGLGDNFGGWVGG